MINNYMYLEYKNRIDKYEQPPTKRKSHSSPLTTQAHHTSLIPTALPRAFKKNQKSYWLIMTMFY